MTTINNLNQTYTGNYNVSNSNFKVTDSLSFTQSVKKETNSNSGISSSTITQEDLKKMESALGLKDLQMNYVKDKETGEHVIQIKDDKNNLIRQIPPKEQLIIRKAIDDFLKNYDSNGNTSNIKNILLNVQS